MPANNDLKLENGIWSRYLNGTWSNLNSDAQQWLSGRYSGVTGTGANQRFETIGWPETAPNRYESHSTVTRALGAAITRSAASQTPMQAPSNPNVSRDPQITQWAREFLGLGPNASVTYPFEDRYGQYDADMMQQFLTWGKATGRFSKDDISGDGAGEVITEKGADGVERTFIRQPDGTLDFVPDVKTSATRGEGKIEFDPITQRNIIRQPDGSIQFAPEQRGTATTGTDETGRRFVTQPDGTRQYLDREYTPGVVSQGGYNLLQQPTGALSQLAPLPEPAGVETVGGMQFIRTSTGELMPLDNVMNRMMENMVVTGDLEGAAAIHAWQTRPSNQEYFDRALAYMRSPADQLVISAIARGQGLVSPPPEETIQRIGPQPDYLTEAFNMLQDQMQMGLPEGTKTFADTLAERAAAAEVEALELANETTRINNNNTQVAGQDAHDAAVIANQTAVVTATDNHTSAVLDQEAADINNSIAATGNGGDEPVDSTVIDSGGRPGGMSQLQWEYQQAVDAYNDAMGWTGRTPGNPLSPADQLIGDAARGGATIANLIAILQQNTPDPEELSESSGEPPLGPGLLNVGEESEYIVPPTGSSSWLLDMSEEEADAVSSTEPLTFQEAVAQIREESPSSADTVFAAPSGPGLLNVGEESGDIFDPGPGLLNVGEESEDVAPITTEDALASFGNLPMDSYTTTTPEPTPVATSSIPDPDEYAGRWYDEGAHGIRTGTKPTLVGESGPELAIFPNGTEIVPLDRKMKPDQARRLRRRGIRGMQEGGIVFDSPLPLGIRQLQAGRSLGAPRGQLLRTAGIALPSAQARRRMLPSEREAFGELGRLAGIPEAEFQQELGITTPSGTPRAGSARMLPLSLRR
jgi:hypothetical protein